MCFQKSLFQIQSLFTLVSFPRFALNNTHTHTYKNHTPTHKYIHTYTDLMNEVTMLSVLYSQNTAVCNTLTNTDIYIKKKNKINSQSFMVESVLYITINIFIMKLTSNNYI